MPDIAADACVYFLKLAQIGQLETEKLSVFANGIFVLRKWIVFYD